MVIREKWRSIRSERRRPKNRSANLSIDSTDTLFRGKKNLSSYHSLGNHRDFPEQLIFESINDIAQNVDFTTSSESDKEVQSSPLKDIEAEFRRMKLELKQTIGLCNIPCKKVVTTKKKLQVVVDAEPRKGVAIIGSS